MADFLNLMHIAEIKRRIHERIDNVREADVLLVIDELLAQDEKLSSEIVIAPEQKLALQESENDLIAGRTLTREKAAEQVSDWILRNL